MKITQDIYYKILIKILKVYKAGGVLLVTAAFLILLLNFSPNIWYTVDAGEIDSDTEVLINSVHLRPILQRVDESMVMATNRTMKTNNNFTTARKLPDKDPNLPTEPTVIIEKIGVNAVLHRGTDGESELDKGVWMPPGMPDPMSQEPILLLAHRFGYLSWSGEFRKTNSFYNLPKLAAGDEIIIIWDQRPFKYEVKDRFDAAGNITFSNDLILYTCKFFRSQERIVVIADRK
jgi:sortase (surface protein transpeptidase)